MRKTRSWTLFGALIAIAIAAVPVTAGAAKAVDNCAIVTPAELQTIFGGTFGAGVPVSTSGPTSNSLLANGFPKTGCAFTTQPGTVRPGLVVSTVAVDAVPGKAGAAAFKKAQKENKSDLTKLSGVGKQAFSVPEGMTGTGVGVYALDKAGFVRMYAFAEKYETGTTRTPFATPALGGQVAEMALGNL